MTRSVHIKIADKGWILEKCAREIVERVPGSTYGTDAEPSAELQYYINYSSRVRKTSPIEVGFFTHSERDVNARRRYFEIAADVDHCVCMSARYARELVEQGVPEGKISIIAPGVDLDVFQPKVRIGVVGRTYHTGRKGEALVAEVMDVPGIEWRFTGSGWPAPSVLVGEGEMSSFYNDLDYVLVPALYEGGPMSVLEGLACGVPIISSDVGWAHEFPHIAFENGNAESLRAVLVDLVAKRNAVREPVLGHGWNVWADKHAELFKRLLGNAPAIATSEASAGGERLNVALVTHGTETRSLGGPSVRVPRTATELAKLGIGASLPREVGDNFVEGPLAHIFNVWPGESCFRVLDRARAVGKSTVLSPIFLNLANLRLASRGVPKLFETGEPATAIDQALRELSRALDEEPNLPVREPVPGYHEQVRVCVESADHVIFLSDYERQCLEHIGASPARSSLVRNPVDFRRFSEADPASFREKLGMDDYILCVGRIEPRKNQLVLAHAAKTLGKHVVFIGHAVDQVYAELVRQAAGEFGHFISRIEPTDPLLKSAFAGASAFCLPSWSEGAPLAALEAAATGIPMVLSDRSSEKEYFGDFAEYVNPVDIDGMREALLKASSQREDLERRRALQQHVAENFGWEKYAEKTAEAYAETLAGTVSSESAPNANDGPIYFDLTTSFHASGNPTGIARVEHRALQSLFNQYGDRIVPIVWSSRTKSYLKVSRATALIGTDLVELERMEKAGEVSVIKDDAPTGGRIIVVGGSWIRNGEYISALRLIKKETKSVLTVLVHDLIQMKLAHLYPDGVGAEFESNARRVCEIADDFLVYSDCTRQDLQKFLIDNQQYFRKITKFRLGDMTDLHEGSSDSMEPTSELQQRFAGKTFAMFVSTIEIRKNHALLVNVWRRLVEERGGAAPHLVFVGRSLWRGDEVVGALQREPELAKFVHVLDDVDDQDLDWFYRNCLLTLYPSLYEGWGLPVAESLSYGKLCLTSSRTATREIAPDLTDLLDPYDFRGWLDRISFYLDNPSALERAEEKIRENFQENPWDNSVREIVEKVDDLPPVEVQTPFVFAGQSIGFFSGPQREAAAALSGPGWGTFERNGRWSVGPRSTISFRYLADDKPFYVRLLLHALVRRGQEYRDVRISIGDYLPETYQIHHQSMTLDLEIPAHHARKKIRDVTIAIEPVEILTPQIVSGSPDVRPLGVYLASMQFANEADAFQPMITAPDPAAVPSPGPATASNLGAARELVQLPRRFTGKRFGARLARFIGFDRLWLAFHRRKFRRTYGSINIILDHLQSDQNR